MVNCFQFFLMWKQCRSCGRSDMLSVYGCMLVCVCVCGCGQFLYRCIHRRMILHSFVMVKTERNVMHNILRFCFCVLRNWHVPQKLQNMSLFLRLIVRLLLHMFTKIKITRLQRYRAAMLSVYVCICECEHYQSINGLECLTFFISYMLCIAQVLKICILRFDWTILNLKTV